jgi:hypothetical protein
MKRLDWQRLNFQQQQDILLVSKSPERFWGHAASYSTQISDPIPTGKAAKA